MIAWMLVAVVLLLSFANGANDNLKGVATLLGSGTANYRRALWWATISTSLGSVTAGWFAVDLLKTFPEKGWWQMHSSSAQSLLLLWLAALA